MNRADRYSIFLDLDGFDSFGCRVLIFANKRDLPNAMPLDQLIDRLANPSVGGRDRYHEQRRLPGLVARLGPRGERWEVQGCVATTGEGLWEGLEWVLSPAE